PIKIFQEEARYIPITLTRAKILFNMKQNDLADKNFEDARLFLEEKLKERSNDAPLLSSLGIAYAGLGRKEDAIREGKKATELVPLSIDKFNAPEFITDMAEIYTMVGEYDLAFDQIDILLKNPTWFSVNLLKVDPVWDPLRSHPRYTQIIAKYSKL
ncbi:hypothetical protein L0244_36215, partial [bacterium]|nr:hypothetical protein [bacterium]